MSRRSLLSRLQDITPDRAGERSGFDEAGFRGFSVRSPLGPISKLTVKGAVAVLWRRSCKMAVVVAGDSQEECDAIATRFSGETLTVEGNGAAGVSVVGDGNVVSLDVATGGSVWINGVLVDTASSSHAQAAVLIVGPAAPAVNVCGSGDVVVQGVDQQSLELSVQGSGDIEVDGRVGCLTAEVAGSGDIDASELVAHSVDCSVTGSGDIDVHAVHDIRARVAGSGDVTVRGAPGVRDSRVAGSGDIRFKKATRTP